MGQFSFRLVLLCCFLSFIGVACGGGTAVSDAPVTATPLAATATATATTAAAPSPRPTSTATATTTATATATASPSPSPSPTTTVSPTASPSPLPSETPPPPSATPPPPPTAAPQTAVIPIGEAAAHMGQEATVSGRVVDAASFSGGFRFTLDDGTGRITLLLWRDVYDDCWDAPELNMGAMVRAGGEIGQYEGDLQIVPDFGGDVKVTTPGDPLAPRREIGALGDHVGERVTISGAVIRVEGTGSGVKLFVGDDTGEVAVFIWQNILERIPNNTALGDPGTAVRVTGRVQLYRSNREVVPALPYDVVVSP